MGFEYRTFEIGFWHPFGPHAGESAEDIIERKRREIESNGWTLWSFQFRNTLGLWRQKIEKMNPRNVLVFCSEGKGARDPKGDRKCCTYYVPVGEVGPKAIPSKIKVPHPMGDKTKGSAFIVRNIIYPAQYEAISVEWLKDDQWQSRPLPTRPEYLIKCGQGLPMRKFRAVLELQTPYLAEVGV
jgi:hypothetical protein